MRWPKGPPHLALNPPYLFFCFFSSLPFLSLYFIRKTCFPPSKRQFLFIYLCFPLFLFSLVWASPCFPFLFLCLSLSLSISLSLVIFFLLPSCFSFLFLVLALSFCLFFCFKMLFCFVFLLVVLLCFESSCLISCCFASCFLLLVVFGFCCFHSLLFFDFNYLSKIISEKIGNCKKNKNEKCTKKDILTRAVSTGVLTKSVFFSFCVSLNFTFLLKTL